MSPARLPRRAAVLALCVSVCGTAHSAPGGAGAPTGAEPLAPPTGDPSDLTVPTDDEKPLPPPPPAPEPAPERAAPAPTETGRVPPPAPPVRDLPEAEYPAREQRGDASGEPLPELAAPAKASPSAHKHDGFFMRLGFGLTYTGITDDPGISRRGANFGSGYEMLFGGTPWEGVVIGGGFLGNGLDTTFPLAVYAGFVQYYPDPRKGLHLQVLGGGAILTDRSKTAGPAVGAGVGYDSWIGRQTSLGAFARLGYAAVSSTTTATPAIRGSAVFFTADVTFTWH